MNQQNNDTPLYYSMILATAIVNINGEPQMLDTQFFTSGPEDNFPARRLVHVQNVAANKVKEDYAVLGDIEFLQVHIRSIIPCGRFTRAEFWKGMEGSVGAAQEGVANPGANAQAPVAANATVGGDNVRPFPLKSDPLADAIGNGLSAEAAGAGSAPAETPMPAAIDDAGPDQRV